jgi:hypothetical protein
MPVTFKAQTMTTKTLTRLIVAGALAVPAAAGLHVADPAPACAAIFPPLALRAEFATLGGSVLLPHPAIGPFAASPASTKPGRPRILRITP